MVLLVLAWWVLHTSEQIPLTRIALPRTAATTTVRTPYDHIHVYVHTATSCSLLHLCMNINIYLWKFCILYKSCPGYCTGEWGYKLYLLPCSHSSVSMGSQDPCLIPGSRVSTTMSCKSIKIGYITETCYCCKKAAWKLGRNFPWLECFGEHLQYFLNWQHSTHESSCSCIDDYCPMWCICMYVSLRIPCQVAIYQAFVPIEYCSTVPVRTP